MQTQKNPHLTFQQKTQNHITKPVNSKLNFTGLPIYFSHRKYKNMEKYSQPALKGLYYNRNKIFSKTNTFLHYTYIREPFVLKYMYTCIWYRTMDCKHLHSVNYIWVFIELYQYLQVLEGKHSYFGNKMCRVSSDFFVILYNLESYF